LSITKRNLVTDQITLNERTCHRLPNSHKAKLNANNLCSSRKREARLVHKRAEFAQKVHGLRAKLHHQRRHAEKIEMKKTYAISTLALCLRTLTYDNLLVLTCIKSVITSTLKETLLRMEPSQPISWTDKTCPELRYAHKATTGCLICCFLTKSITVLDFK